MSIPAVGPNRLSCSTPNDGCCRRFDFTNLSELYAQAIRPAFYNAPTELLLTELISVLFFSGGLLRKTF